jgi:DNA replication protein DnaC
VLKTLEQFDFTWPTKINRLAVQNLFRLKFIEDKANAIVVGGVGLGKSHLCIALGYAAATAGFSVRFTTAIDIVNKLAAAQNAGRLVQELKKYTRPDVLLVDEVGCASRSTKTPCRARDPTRSRRSGFEKLRAGNASA